MGGAAAAAAGDQQETRPHSVTRPERPKGVKDEVKEARRAAD